MQQSVSDPEEESEDVLFKVRRFISSLRNNCEKLWTLNKFVSLDEIDIGFQGRMAKLKERIKFKKEGDGFLLDAICDAITGYLYTFHFRGDETWTVFDATYSALHNRCLYLFSRIKHDTRGMVVCMDNLFTSLKFFRALWDHFGIMAVGVCRTYQRGFPNQIVQTEGSNKNEIESLRRTCLAKVYVDACFECLAASYYDTKPVHLLSTFHKVAEEVFIPKKVWNEAAGMKEWISIPRLNIIDFYNKYMDGVDMQDQLRW